MPGGLSRLAIAAVLLIGLRAACIAHVQAGVGLVFVGVAVVFESATDVCKTVAAGIVLQIVLAPDVECCLCCTVGSIHDVHVFVVAHGKAVRIEPRDHFGGSVAFDRTGFSILGNAHGTGSAFALIGGGIHPIRKSVVGGVPGDGVGGRCWIDIHDMHITLRRAVSCEVERVLSRICERDGLVVGSRHLLDNAFYAGL